MGFTGSATKCFPSPELISQHDYNKQASRQLKVTRKKTSSAKPSTNQISKIQISKIQDSKIQDSAAVALRHQLFNKITPILISSDLIQEAQVRRVVQACCLDMVAVLEDIIKDYRLDASSAVNGQQNFSADIIARGNLGKSTLNAETCSRGKLKDC